MQLRRIYILFGGALCTIGFILIVISSYFVGIMSESAEAKVILLNLETDNTCYNLYIHYILTIEETHDRLYYTKKVTKFDCGENIRVALSQAEMLYPPNSTKMCWYSGNELYDTNPYIKRRNILLSGVFIFITGMSILLIFSIQKCKNEYTLV